MKSAAHKEEALLLNTTETFICQNWGDLQKRGRSAAYREGALLLNLDKNDRLFLYFIFCSQN